MVKFIHITSPSELTLPKQYPKRNQKQFEH